MGIRRAAIRSKRRAEREREEQDGRDEMWVKDFTEWSRGRWYEADPEVYHWSVGNQYSDEWEEHDDLGRNGRADADPDLYGGTSDPGFLPIFTDT